MAEVVFRKMQKKLEPCKLQEKIIEKFIALRERTLRPSTLLRIGRRVSSSVY